MPGLDDLVRRWRFRRNASATVALCDSLAEAAALPGAKADPALIDEVGQFASVLAPPEVRVLVAAGRMRLASGDTHEAESLLVRAEALEPSPDLVRLIAEARLRRGDAEGAARAFERCVEGGVNDADTLALKACAEAVARAQAASGPDSAAREVEREIGAPGSRYRLPYPRVAATVPRPPPSTDHDVTVQGGPDRGLLKAAGAPPDATVRQPLAEVLAMAVGSRRSAVSLEPATAPEADAAAASPAAQLPRAPARTYGPGQMIAVFAAGIAVGAATVYWIGMSGLFSEPPAPASPPASAPARAPQPAPGRAK
jgi:hypothetical protein